MLKWILGIAGALVLLLAGTCWYGYSRLTAGGDTARVAIASTADRVWMHLVMVDSLRVWQDSTASVSTSGDSVLAVGDTLRIESRPMQGTTRGEQRMRWVVRRLEAPTVVAWAALDDSSGTAIVARTDSIAVIGDSVIVTSTFGSPLVDSLRADGGGGGMAQRFLGGVGKMATGAMRAIAEQDLARLKARLEQP